jgi:hypothetical protein
MNFSPPTIAQRGQLAKAMAQAYDHRPEHGETRVRLTCSRCKGTILATVQSDGISRGQCRSVGCIAWTQ